MAKAKSTVETAPRTMMAEVSPQAGAPVFGTDDSYLSQQHCSTTGASLTTTKTYEIGIWRDAMTCPGVIDWYQEGIDFTKTLGGVTGEFTVARETVDSASAYETTKSGKITRSKAFTIKPTAGSRLVQKFAEIDMRDSTEGLEGKLIQTYSDGGFHIRTTISDTLTGAQQRQVALNVKCENFIDMFSLDFDDAELEFELNFLVEWAPIYELIGALPKTFSWPTNTAAPDITVGAITSTATDISIAAVTLLDPDMLLTNTNVKVVAYDETNAKIGETSVATGSAATITGLTLVAGDVVNLYFSYYLTPTTTYTIKIVQHTVVI